MSPRQSLCIFSLCAVAAACRSPTEPTSIRPTQSSIGPEDDDEPLTLSLATWNLEWLNASNDAGPNPRGDADYERLRHYASLLDADVIALQEVQGEAAAARVFSPDEYAYHFSSSGGSQRSGFAYRKHLDVAVHDDFAELSLDGTLRGGADISVRLGDTELRLLGVHLKSGCFDTPIDSSGSNCQRLNRQNELVEQWVDQHVAAGDAFAILGDFNRRLNEADSFLVTLSDGDPAGAELELATAGHSSRCWGGEYPEFIDHILLSQEVSTWWQKSSFEQLLFDPADRDQRDDDYVLSDHCPIRIALWPENTKKTLRRHELLAAPKAEPRALPAARPVPVQPSTASLVARPATTAQLKGNISGARRLYHLPGCPGYAATRIDEKKGERWFDSEEAAQSAGWTRAGNCPPETR